MVTNDRVPNFNIFWEGWKTDIFTLNQHGWVVYRDQYLETFETKIALKNNRINTIAVSLGIDSDFMRSYNINPDYTRGLRFEDNHHFPTIRMQHMHYKGNIRLVNQGTLHSMKPVESVDMWPGMSEVKLETYFADEPQEAAQQIIMPSYTIADLMKMIKEKQQPLQKEILEQQNRNAPQRKVEAQIISINA